MYLHVLKILSFMHIILQCYSFTLFAKEKTSKNNSKKNIDLNRKYNFQIHMNDKKINKAKVIEASPKKDKLKFNIEVFNEEPIKNSFFYLLNKSETKIIAELTLVKIRKMIAYAEIGRITQNLERDDFKDLSIVSSSDINKLIKNYVEFRKNPYTNFGYLYSTGLLKSSNIISNLNLDSIASSQGYYFTVFAPLNNAIPRINWFGLSTKFRNINPIETKIISLEKDLQQTVKVDGSQVSVDFIIRPWTRIPFVHNFSIITGFYNNKTINFKLAKEETLNLSEKSLALNKLGLLENANALDMTFKESFLLLGLDIGFNPHQNLFFGLSYFNKMSHKFDITNNLDETLSNSGTITGNIMKSWVKTYFPISSSIKFFLKFMMEFHKETIKRENAETTHNYEESQILIGIGYAP